MNKSELIEVLAQRADFTKKDAETAINSFTEVVKEALANGDSVELIGFGSFKVVDRAARQGRNPQTGETISIPASKAPKFTAGKKLKEAVK